MPRRPAQQPKTDDAADEKRRARPGDLPPDAPWPLASGIVWRPYGDGSPRFQVFSRATGRKEYVDCTPYYSEALELKRRYEVRVEAEALVGEREARAKCRLTLHQALGQWTEFLDRTKFPSAKKYAAAVRVHVVDELVAFTDSKADVPRKFGDIRIDKITRGLVMRWRNGLLNKKAAPNAHGDKLSTGHINTTVRTLSSAFKWFVKMDMLDANPLSGIEDLPVAERQKTIIESRRQITGLLRECYKRGGIDLQDIAITLIATGLRISEAIYIRKADVYLDNVVDGQPCPWFKIEGKGDKARGVPIFDVLLPVFARRMQEQPDHSLLFPGKPHWARAEKPKHPNRREVRHPLRPGEVAHSRSTIYKQWLDAIAAYNAKHPDAPLSEDMRLHDTRHTFGTHWVETEGGDIYQLQRVMGHSDPRITADVYARLSVRTFAGKLDRMAFEVPESPKQLLAGKSE